ncbi:MAG: holin family protein [Pseudomonadota bacterium]
MGLSAGLLGSIFNLLFGNDRNAITETVEVFRTNAEGQAARDARHAAAALEQFAQEFAVPRRGLFDRMIDAVNRIPRPALALGTLGLFVSAMVDPIWFAARMQGIALVPEPLWWLLGAVVSFYFGARHQAKSQEFQNSISATLARAPHVTEGLRALQALEAGAREPAPKPAAPAPAPAPADQPTGVADPEGGAPERGASNPALAEWRAERDRH